MKTTVLFSMHLKDVLQRIAAKKLAPKTKNDYIKLQGLLASAGLRDVEVGDLNTAHFANLMAEIEARNYSFRTQQNLISSIKTVFNWGGPKGMGITVLPPFGPRFIAPSRRKIEAEQEEQSPSKFIEREAILAALDIADSKTKIAILLGINCGFYPSDTIGVRVDHFHLAHDPPYHSFRRVKTMQKRRAVLWPETVKAICYYHRHVKKSAHRRKKHLLLLPNGHPHSQNSDKLATPFRRLMQAVGHYTPGVGLGSLRHTYATIIDTVPDQAMIDLTMGHTSKSIQERTYRQLNVDEFDRLAFLADTVRFWLYDLGSVPAGVSGRCKHPGEFDENGDLADPEAYEPG